MKDQRHKLGKGTVTVTDEVEFWRAIKGRERRRVDFFG